MGKHGGSSFPGEIEARDLVYPLDPRCKLHIDREGEDYYIEINDESADYALTDLKGMAREHGLMFDAGDPQMIAETEDGVRFYLSVIETTPDIPTPRSAMPLDFESTAYGPLSGFMEAV
jgi:hypothetical protein